MSKDIKDLLLELRNVYTKNTALRDMLAETKSAERGLLLQILNDRADHPGKTALLLDHDVAVVIIDEDWFDFSDSSQHKAVTVEFIPYETGGAA